MRTEDLIEIENAGRRCGVCQSGRRWRRFELVRPAGREPVVLCANCRARFGDDPPVGRKPAPTLEPVPATAEPPAPPDQRPGERGIDQRPDRLRAALRRLPGSFSTAMAARAAGLNLGREAVGVAWVARAKAIIYQDFIASPVEAEPGTSPTAPMCATTSRQTSILQGFSSRRSFAQQPQSPPKPLKHRVSEQEKTPHLRGFYRGARI